VAVGGTATGVADGGTGRLDSVATGVEPDEQPAVARAKSSITSRDTLHESEAMPGL
jgi:hypothetical protein